MPISEDEFNQLEEKSPNAGGFGPRENSLMGRVRKALPEDGGKTAVEIAEEIGEVDNQKKVTQALRNLCYRGKVKAAKKRYDTEGTAYFKKNPEYVEKKAE